MNLRVFISRGITIKQLISTSSIIEIDFHDLGKVNMIWNKYDYNG